MKVPALLRFAPTASWGGGFPSSKHNYRRRKIKFFFRNTYPVRQLLLAAPKAAGNVNAQFSFALAKSACARKIKSIHHPLRECAHPVAVCMRPSGDDHHFKCKKMLENFNMLFPSATALVFFPPEKRILPSSRLALLVKPRAECRDEPGFARIFAFRCCLRKVFFPQRRLSVVPILFSFPAPSEVWLEKLKKTQNCPLERGGDPGCVIRRRLFRRMTTVRQGQRGRARFSGVLKDGKKSDFC